MLNYNAYYPDIYIYDPRLIFSGGDNFNDNKESANKPKFASQDAAPKTVSIILADDDADDREFFKEAIEESGLNVKLDFAEDGNCLTSILNASKNLPDLIFLDLNMPNKNGKECLVEIRKSVRLKDIPVVIYSTSSSMRDIDETFEMGANLYVKKPTSMRELTVITKTVLSLDWHQFKPYTSRSHFLYSPKTE